jgi:hypothetical protein
MDPLHAPIEEFAAEGFTGRVLPVSDDEVRPISWLPRLSMGRPSRSFRGGSGASAIGQ